MTTEPETCKAMLRDKVTGEKRPCQLPVLADGWCYLHHPDAVELRRNKRDAKRTARRDMMNDLMIRIQNETAFRMRCTKAVRSAAKRLGVTTDKIIESLETAI